MTNMGTKGLVTFYPSGSIGLISRNPRKVVDTVMQVFPMNIKMCAIPSTIANLTEFLRVRRNALMAELQKDSLERAM